MTDNQVDTEVDSDKGQTEMEENLNKDETLLDEEPAIPFNWKKELPSVIRSGNIDRLEELMETEDFDINTTWENLLMIAIRAGQTKMAEFLIDNGINYNFTRTVLDYKRSTQQIDCYVVNCRQLAYDHQLTDIVHLIDQKNKQLFSFVKLRQRIPRIHHSKSLAADDSAEVPGSCLGIRAEDGRKQEKNFIKSKTQNISNSYNRGLNLHRLTPDLILLERKRGQRIFVPLYGKSPRSRAVRNYVSSAEQSGASPSVLSSLSNHPQWDTSSDWLFQIKNDRGREGVNTRLATGCWEPKNNSWKVTSVERQFQEISCGAVISERGRSQMPQKNNKVLTKSNTTMWINKPKS